MSLPIVLVAGRKGSGKDTMCQMMAQQVPSSATIALADPMKRFVAQLFDLPEEALWGASWLRERPYPCSTQPLGWGEAEECATAFFRGELKLHFPERAFKDWYQGELERYERAPMAYCARMPLQTFGTELVRNNLGKNVWVDKALATADLLLAGGHDYGQAAGLTRSDAGFRDAVFISDGRFGSEVLRTRQHGGLVLKVERPDLGAVQDGHSSETELDRIPRSWFNAIVTNGKDLDHLEMKARWFREAYVSPVTV